MHATTPSGGHADRRASEKVKIALTVPSSAFTGWPSAPTIDLGSAKNDRYSSHGTSAISSEAGTGPAYAPRACRRCPAGGLSGLDAAGGGRRGDRARRLRATLWSGARRRSWGRGRAFRRRQRKRRLSAEVGLGRDAPAVFDAEVRPRAVQPKPSLQFRPAHRSVAARAEHLRREDPWGDAAPEHLNPAEGSPDEALQARRHGGEAHAELPAG